MTQTAAFTAEHGDFADRRAAAPKKHAGPGLLARIVQAIRASRQRRAEAAVGRYIQDNGGVLTDELERRISRNYWHIVGDR